MGSAAENKITKLCTNPRLALGATPYIHLPGELQRSMLEWMQQEANGFPNVMGNATLIGPRPFIFSTDKLTLTNETYLHQHFEEPAVAIALAKELMELVGVVDQPMALRFNVRHSADVSAHFVILPVVVIERKFQILRVAGW